MKGRVVSLILTCLLSIPAWSDDQAERKRLQKVEREIRDLQQQLTRTHSAHERLNTELQESELKLSRLQEQVDHLESELSVQNEELGQLQGHVAVLESKRRKQSDFIRQEVVAAYRLGQEEPLKMVLNQQDPQLIARQLRYYQYFLSARADKLASYRTTLSELNETEKAVRAKREQLLENRTRLDSQRQQVLTEQENRHQLLVSLEKQLGSEKGQLRALQQQRTQLEAVIAALEKAIRELKVPASTPFARSKGKMVRPVDGKVIKAFGSSRATNLNWLGWLVSARAGTPVRAIHHGRVVFSDYLRGQGLLLIIDHGDGYLSLYAHNQNLLRETGDWVQAGETIANAGNSGGLQDSALYFEIRHNGKPLDPKLWLAHK